VQSCAVNRAALYRVNSDIVRDTDRLKVAPAESPNDPQLHKVAQAVLLEDDHLKAAFEAHKERCAGYK
jgi:hypothetical protein